MVCLLIQHANNETNENAWLRLPPASGRSPPAIAVSVTGNVGHGSTTEGGKGKGNGKYGGDSGKGMTRAR